VDFLIYVLITLLWITSIFLIILVLIQRGRGGGLAGALGGMGGQSAFGAKAGDTFTRITVGVASAWILICISLFYIYSHRQLYTGGGGAANNSGASSQTQDQ
jgi:preprotein translocase subunit SecG